jgi:hypothetical protein
MVAVIPSWIMSIVWPSIVESAPVIVASRISIARAIVERKPTTAVAIAWPVVVAWRASGGIGVVTAVRVDLHAKINGLYFYFCSIDRR